MVRPGVRAYMRIAALAVVLILAACGGSAGPKAQSSLQPSATPTPIVATPTASPTPTPPPAGSRLTWAAPVRVDNPASFHGVGLVRVSCVSSGLCVVADDDGNVVTSTNPTGGPSAWTVANVDVSVGPNSNGPRLVGVSCPTSGLCVAVDSDGNIITSTKPTGGATAWTAVHVGSANYLTGVSCPSISLCVAVGASGVVVTSTNPSGGVAAWKVAKSTGPISS